MKNNYVAPEAKVVLLESVDVIRTSPVLEEFNDKNTFSNGWISAGSFSN